VMASEYKEYCISAWARPEFTNGYTSVGIVSKQSRLGSYVQVQRIEGWFFHIKDDAEQHGIELCKEWVDNEKGRSTLKRIGEDPGYQCLQYGDCSEPLAVSLFDHRRRSHRIANSPYKMTLHNESTESIYSPAIF
jgi:hypothetical protein